MYKKLFYLIVLFIAVKASAQSYMGYVPDNYAGVQGVLFNPASIVDSRFKTDINLFSTSVTVANDYFGVSLFDVYKDTYDVEKEGTRTASEKNGGIVYSDIMGPSFMFNIAPKHAVAIFTRARAVVNVNNVNGYLYDKFKDGLGETATFPSFEVGDTNLVGHSWGEVGASYAAVLYQNKQHFLKAGLTVKYLIGGINSYARANNVTSAYIQTNNPSTNTVITTGDLTIGSSQDIITGNQDYKFDSNSTGFGADLGLIYEWRPDYDSYDLNNAKAVDNNFKDLNKYKLRFGISVTDIGSINYKNAKEDFYNINGNFSEKDLDDADDIGDFLKTHYGDPTTTYKNINANLPTAMHIDVDWNMYRKFYLNLNGTLSLIDKSILNKTYSPNVWLLTPRFESKWFTFSVPVNYMEYSGLQVGSSLRVGPLFIGSSSIITNAVSKKSKAADIYLGLKIPVYQGKFKDSDGDGVLDKNDKCRKVAGAMDNKGCPWPDTDGDTVVDKDDSCPKVAGPVENQGCPWGDVDNDTVMDNVDACPNVAGPVENKGCPWPDTDGDTVLDKDDKCPDVFGLVANQGCPEMDADKDGVLDKDDACPTVPGPASNKGCPEVTAEVLKELKVQARAVFFVTGKAVLQTADKGQTDGRLDAIKEIIKNYPTAKFSIEGHTDSVGNAASNQKLSEARAKVVMNALIAKGVNPANLSSVGYGATKPVASNKTPDGRAENRRTEVIHVGTTYEGKL